MLRRKRHKLKPTSIYTYLPKESTIDYQGHLSILMFTAGCNFKCRYCHNPELIPKKNDCIKSDDLEKILIHAKENWVDAISISGGEPTMSPILPDTLQIIKSYGFKIKLDTQGSFPNILQEVLPYLDYIAMDYKMPIEKLSQLTQTNAPKESINRSLDLIKNSGVDYEIRTTVVPGLHSESDMMKICEEITTVKRFILQPFVPRENLPDPSYQKKPRTPIPLLERFQRVCQDYIQHVIVR
jgi:pyruvate formate lyase activating enzyme